MGVPNDKSDEPSSELKALLALEREAAAYGTVSRYVLDYAMVPMIAIGLVGWCRWHSALAQLYSLIVLLFSTAFIVERRAQARMKLMLTVLRSHHQQPNSPP